MRVVSVGEVMIELVRGADGRFAMDEVLPVANELDPRHEDIPEQLLGRMGELGLFGILIGEDEGGLGLGVLEYCLVSEELARAWMSVGSIIARGNGTGCDSPDPVRRGELRRPGEHHEVGHGYFGDDVLQGLGAAGVLDDRIQEFSLAHAVDVLPLRLFLAAEYDSVAVLDLDAEYAARGQHRDSLHRSPLKR